MKVYYDFHIHSCLSPCADDEMTPLNIVNMAKLSGLDVIAVTDHNTCKNCEAVMKAGEEIGLLVLPGMELCTVEETHIVCLFETLEAAMQFDHIVEQTLMPVQNKPEIFGHQYLMKDDKVIGEYPTLLVTAASISIGQCAQTVRSLGGVCYPAHIDRASYSVLSILGCIPQEGQFHRFEATAAADLSLLLQKAPELATLSRMISSDAHELGNIADADHELTCAERTAASVMEALRK